MRTIKFDDYLEKRLKEPEFKTNFENENAKLNLALALLEDEDTVNSIDENDLEAQGVILRYNFLFSCNFVQGFL